MLFMEFNTKIEHDLDTRAIVRDSSHSLVRHHCL